MHCCIPRLQCHDAANTKAPDLYTALIATAKRFEKVIDPSNRPRDATPANSSIYPCVQTPKFGPSTLPEVSEFYQNSPPKLWGGWMAKNNFFRETLVALTSPFTITTGDTETRALMPATAGFHRQRRSVISPPALNSFEPKIPGSQFIRARLDSIMNHNA